MNSAFVGYEELSRSPRGCYPPRPSASVDHTLLDLLNSSYTTQPHSLIANYTILIILFFIFGLSLAAIPACPILKQFPLFDQIIHIPR